MTIYNANVSNIRRSVVDAVSPEDCEPYPNTRVQPIAWYAEVAGGPFALRVHDTALLAAAVSGPSKEVLLAPTAVVLPLSGAVGWSPWFNIDRHVELGFWLNNTGAVATTVMAWQLATGLAGGGVVSNAQAAATVYAPGGGWYPYDSLPIAGNFCQPSISRCGWNGLSMRWGWYIAAGVANGEITLAVLGTRRI